MKTIKNPGDNAPMSGSPSREAATSQNANNQPNSIDLITQKEAAKICGVKPGTIQSWITKNKLTPQRKGHGNMNLFLRSDVEKLTKQKKSTSQANAQPKSNEPNQGEPPTETKTETKKNQTPPSQDKKNSSNQQRGEQVNRHSENHKKKQTYLKIFKPKNRNERRKLMGHLKRGLALLTLEDKAKLLREWNAEFKQATNISA